MAFYLSTNCDDGTRETNIVEGIISVELTYINNGNAITWVVDITFVSNGDGQLFFRSHFLQRNAAHDFYQNFMEFISRPSAPGSFFETEKVSDITEYGDDIVALYSWSDGNGKKPTVVKTGYADQLHTFHKISPKEEKQKTVEMAIDPQEMLSPATPDMLQHPLYEELRNLYRSGLNHLSDPVNHIVLYVSTESQGTPDLVVKYKPSHDEIEKHRSYLDAHKRPDNTMKGMTNDLSTPPKASPA